MLMGLLASTPAWIFACLVLPCWGHTWAYNLRCSCPTSTLRLGGAGGWLHELWDAGRRAGWPLGSLDPLVGWRAACLHLAIWQFHLMENLCRVNTRVWLLASDQEGAM